MWGISVFIANGKVNTTVEWIVLKLEMSLIGHYLKHF